MASESPHVSAVLFSFRGMAVASICNLTKYPILFKIINNTYNMCKGYPKRLRHPGIAQHSVELRRAGAGRRAVSIQVIYNRA